MWPTLKQMGGVPAMVIFLEKASRYFKNRPTGGEDKVYWANEINSDRCLEIANFLKELD